MKETIKFELILAQGIFEVEDGRIVETPINIRGLKGYTLEEAQKVVSRHNQTLRFSPVTDAN